MVVVAWCYRGGMAERDVEIILLCFFFRRGGFFKVLGGNGRVHM